MNQPMTKTELEDMVRKLNIIGNDDVKLVWETDDRFPLVRVAKGNNPVTPPETYDKLAWIIQAIMLKHLFHYTPSYGIVQDFRELYLFLGNDKFDTTDKDSLLIDYHRLLRSKK